MRSTGKIHKKISQRSAWGLFFVLPHFIGVSVFFMVPYADVLRRAFLPLGISQGISFTNFQIVMENKAFQLAMKNSLCFIMIALPLLLTSSLIFALGLKRLEKVELIIKRLMLVPLVIPVVSVVLLWKFMFHSQGFLNGGLKLFGIPGIEWMNSKAAIAVLVFSYIWKNIGYYIILWLTALLSIPDSVYEAARVDRANNLQCFLHITLPSLRTSVFMISVLALVNSFKVFREAYLVAGDYPDKSIYLLQHLFNNWFRSLEINKMSAGAVIISLILFCLILIFQKASKAGEEKG